MSKNLKLGAFLVRKGIITEEQSLKASQRAASDAVRFESALLSLDFTSETELIPAAAEFYGLPVFNAGGASWNTAALASVSPGFANQHSMIPFDISDGTLKIAAPLGFDPLALDAVRIQTGLIPLPHLGSRDGISAAIKKHYGLGAETIERMIEERGLHLEILGAGEQESEHQEVVDTAPVVRFVDQLILEALKDRATDIHIEPFENSLRIRTRIDGVLFETPAPPGIARFHPAIVSRIKIMADMDIAEKRLPQDGRVKLRAAGEELDLRISTIPTPFGESVGIRILRRSMMLMGLPDLGMSSSALDTLNSIIHSPNGIVLVTGPTGSGKTTTLYAALNALNSPDRKIITIEDPIEYLLRGISQIQVKPSISLTFASGLRSILRHDPDIIMVGEIRDLETAEIAIRSALTGHLVFSTLHTNDAAGAITRLLDMGIEPYLVASSVRTVIAQRLVRTLCPKCAKPAVYDAAALRRAGIPVRKEQQVRLQDASGCDACRRQGYLGRTGIYEILTIDDGIRKLILDRVSTETIRRKALESGMDTLRDDGWDKTLHGVTSLEEILRVTTEN